MSKQSLLLVDHDTRSMRVLEVSLRKAGFTVTTAVSVDDAVEKLDVHPPDLIISETTFPADQEDGFELRRRVRARPEWAEIPFIFLTAEQTIENKIKGLELGVDDYLTKPIYIKEIVTRINILLQKRQRVRFEERRDGRTRFAGRVQDMPVVDVIQTIEISRKSGVIQFVGDRGRQAAIYFRDGRVIDAEAAALQGEDAVYRLLTWSEGEFEVVFRTVRRREVITTSSQGLLMEGMRRLDEWSRLLEQLPPLTHRFEVDARELSIRLGDIPDTNNAILRLIDGKRTLLEVIDASDVGDLECLQAISRLYFEEMLIDLDQGKGLRRDSGRTAAVLPPLGLADSGPHARVVGPIEISEPYPAAPGAMEPSRTTSEDDLAPAAAAEGAGASGAPAPSEAAIDRPSGSIPVDEGDIHEEVADAPDASTDADADAMPGALRGSYRPSSLRLIDEAVAAAQAIEPSLFEDEPAAASARPTPSNAPAEAAPGGVPVAAAALPSGPVVAAGASALPGLVRLSVRPDPDDPESKQDESNGVPGVAHDDVELDYPEHVGADDPTPTPIVRRSRPSSPKPLRDETSGLRMIGSHGRDRAEASGELALGATSSPVTTTQRELVTIMPRRSTRELPIVGADPKAEPEVVGLDDDTPPVSTLAASAAAAAGAVAAAEPAPRTDAEAPRRAEPQPRSLPVEPPRTITPIGDRSEPTPAKRGFRKWLAVILVAAALGGLYGLVQRSKQDPAPVATTTEDAIDAAAAVAVDAAVAEVAIADAAVAIAVDAGREPILDAAVAIDAARPAVPDAAPAASSPEEQARKLYVQANAALAEGDAARALELADASLNLRRTARAHLSRATALQRLDRIDEAIEATHAAERISPDFTLVYDLRGRILWSARRFDEARVAFEKFLELDPDSKRAREVRRLLDRPQ